MLATAGMLFLLSSCKLDNYPGPDAQIHGKILDAKTKELVGTDIQNGSQLKIYEQGFAAAENRSNGRTLVIQNTGEYRNNMMFAAEYEVVFENGNFYGFNQMIDVKKGDNEFNWEVTPYLRVKDCSITKSGTVVTAKFKLEGGKGDEKVNQIQLFAFSDIWVGNYVKYDIDSPDKLNNPTDKANPNEVVNPSKEYTLSIDTGYNNNKMLFKYPGKNYYFRVGAQASVPGAGQIRHNYSELVVIPL